MSLINLSLEHAYCSNLMSNVVGFLGYPQPGGGTHPSIPSEGALGEVLGDWANLALRQAHKNTRSRVVRAAGA